MSKRTKYEPGTFSWVELTTTDTAAAKEFYGGLFGWESEDLPVPNSPPYTMLSVDSARVAALYQQPEEQRSAGVPPNWFSYVTVASADDAAERAKELGGAVHAGPFDVMDAGRMAVIADPTGAMIGAWEAREAIGAERVNEPGSLTWNDLATNDVPRAIEFYSGLFDWEVEEIDTGGGPRYWQINHAGGAGGRNGGMRELGPEQQGVPPHWMPYFVVESAAAATARTTENGGAVLAGPIDLPTGSRFAVISDPQGATFGIFEGEVDD
jgi:predicted enzyme related to lactoylglutathione lyase